MVEFFAALALLSFGFAIEAVSLEISDLSIGLVNPFLISTVLPILYRTQIGALAQNRQLFAAFMDHLPAYAWIKNTDGSYLYVNERVKTLSPFQHDCLGKTDADLWPSELAVTYRANDLKVIATGEKVETVESFVLNGEQRHVLVSRFPIFDELGTVVMVGGTSVDITEQKHAEDDLIKQKEILEKIVDRSPVMITFTGSDGRIKLVNREWQQTMGWSLEEILNEDFDLFAECYPNPQDRQETLNFIEAATGEWSDFRARTKDGSMIETSWARVKLSDGRTIGIGQDITAHKRAEHALRQAEQKYRELFENAKDAIYVHDLSGRYTSINRAAEKLSGYSREEILGKNFNSFVAPEYAEHMRENLCKKLQHEGETTYEVEVITKDGRRVPVEVSSRLIYEEGVPVAVQGTARNIAERKRAEEALRGYSRQLIRAQEAERENIARELHDQIGQVLTAVRINLETIRDSANRGEANALIDEGVTIVDEAIQQVRDLSFELRPSLLDDLGLTAALRWYADRYAQRTGIQTKTSICAPSRIRLPRELETACFRIVQEALTNVARHAQAKSVSIGVRTMKGTLSLSIKDDGIGFNLHSQTNGELLNRLGLRGMEERAHGLGGDLLIKSAPHEGTEVRVHFPNGSKRKKLT
jgi:PAS domain S-box-containing protein